MPQDVDAVDDAVMSILYIFLLFPTWNINANTATQ